MVEIFLLRVRKAVTANLGSENGCPERLFLLLALERHGEGPNSSYNLSHCL